MEQWSYPQVFVDAAITIPDTATIKDISNNTVQGGVTQTIVKNQ